MKVAPRNKTAIISFIIDKAVLKLRNVSSNMRKRVAMLLEDKEIVVKEYDSRLLILNGWIKLKEPHGVGFYEFDDVKKGLSNYVISSLDELNQIKPLNNSLRCHNFTFSSKNPLEFDRLYYSRIDQQSYNQHLNCFFNRIVDLWLDSLSSDQNNRILSKFSRIDKLTVYNSSLAKFDFNQTKTKEIVFWNVNFEQKLILPSNLEYLKILNCQGIKNLKCTKTTKLYISSPSSSDEIKWIKRFKSIKEAEIRLNLDFKQNFKILPSTVRDLYWDSEEISCNSIDDLKKHFPFLIKTSLTVPVEIAEALSLKYACLKMNEQEEKFGCRPRRMFVWNQNVEQLNKHAELFEKMEEIDVSTDKFDFDCLPKGIKHIILSKPVDVES